MILRGIFPYLYELISRIYVEAPDRSSGKRVYKNLLYEQGPKSP